MTNKMLYLIRGVAGAGKSTFASKMAFLMVADHFEADSFFMKDGVYKFDPSKLKMAHDKCKQSTETSMVRGRDVIVSNTFTTEREIKPYIDLAEKYGYSVTSLIVENRHGNKSIHNVPDDKIQAMKDRFSVKL